MTLLRRYRYANVTRNCPKDEFGGLKQGKHWFFSVNLLRGLYPKLIVNYELRITNKVGGRRKEEGFFRGRRRWASGSIHQ
jgi:hypothetical protein